MGAGIWKLMAIPIFVLILFLFSTNEDFSLKKVGAVFWIISLVAFAYPNFDNDIQ